MYALSTSVFPSSFSPGGLLYDNICTGLYIRVDYNVSKGRVMDEWWTEKDFGKKRSLRTQDTTPAYTWRDWGKLRKTSVLTAGIPAENRAKHLANSSLKYYLCANSLRSLIPPMLDILVLGDSYIRPPVWDQSAKRSNLFSFPVPIYSYIVRFPTDAKNFKEIVKQ
jgi:hypothetical protein